MIYNIFLLIIGLAVLLVGGEFLVKGAVGIAKKMHISTLVIGMTVVSFGTSAPELLVSLKAAYTGNPEIAIGNVVGSNIANIALVLAITVLIFPIVVDRSSIRMDWPLMMLGSILFYAFSYDNIIETWEGVILFFILIAFTYYLISNSRKKNKAAIKDNPEALDTGIEKTRSFMNVLYLALGLTGLFFGADWLLQGATGIALDAGMEKRVVGVTIVAFGTSVPELVTSGVAAYRKQTDISIGNLIGSNIFNIMAVIGITAIVHPIAVENEALNFDMIWMLAIALALFPLMVIGKRMGSFKGFLLLSTYVIYISILVFSI